METQIAVKDDPRFREPLQLATVARALVVTRETKVKAEQMILLIGEGERQIKAVMDPIRDAANRAHKVATTQTNALLQPLQEAKAYLRRGCADVQKELDEEATIEARRKAAELEELERARLMEKAQTATSPTEVVQAIQEAERVSIPAEVVREAPAKASGITYRDNWTFEWVDAQGKRIAQPDVALIPMQFHRIDDVLVRAHVKATKERTSIPGVRAFNDRQPVGSGR